MNKKETELEKQKTKIKKIVGFIVESIVFCIILVIGIIFDILVFYLLLITIYFLFFYNPTYIDSDRCFPGLREHVNSNCQDKDCGLHSEQYKKEKGLI